MSSREYLELKAEIKKLKESQMAEQAEVQQLIAANEDLIGLVTQLVAENARLKADSVNSVTNAQIIADNATGASQELAKVNASIEAAKAALAS